MVPYHEQALTGFPDIVVRELEINDKIIFLGCDGVFEKLNDYQIRNIIFEDLIENKPLVSPISKIFEETLAPSMSFTMAGYDNMSGILIVLK